MKFSRFQDHIENPPELRISVYRQINRIKKTGLSLQEIFDQTSKLTGVKPSDIDGFLASLSSKRGDLTTAQALYFWFHSYPDDGYAEKIDIALFGRPFEAEFGEPVAPEAILRSSATSIATQRSLPTSKRYDDCAPLRRMARYIAGPRLSQKGQFHSDAFFDVYPTLPRWFEIAQMPHSDVASIVWSATHTLCRAAADPAMLSAHQIDTLSQFLHDYAADIPDAYAPAITQTLQYIRDDLIPEARITDYALFRFERSKKPNADIRRMRMIQRTHLPDRYDRHLDQLYHQHKAALDLLANAKDNITEHGATYPVEMAMALSSVIHALLIDRRNEQGVHHPFVAGWMEQLRAIASAESRALIHLAFAELQIAALRDDPEVKRATLTVLLKRLEATRFASAPITRALRLSRAALDLGFDETAEAASFFALPPDQQVVFVTRCNIGLTPEFRDRFVEHHVETNSALRNSVLARFGSVMR